MKYLVRFKTTSGDHDAEWCHAESPQQAKDQIMHEHWNIETIESVQLISKLG